MPREALPTITVEALAQRVSQSLREAIVSGVLQPGERLVEERIAAEMGVSRAPIREAFMILDAEGLVTSLPRRGVAVAALSKQDVQEVYGLRSALECQAARRACRMITADDVEYLLSLARDMTRFNLPDDSRLLAAQDLAFHQRILEVSGNRRLLEAWLGIMSPVRLLQRHVLTSRDLNLEALARNHEAIVDALRSGDPDAAERCLRDHIETIGHQVFESFPDAQAEPASARQRSRIAR